MKATLSSSVDLSSFHLSVGVGDWRQPSRYLGETSLLSVAPFAWVLARSVTASNSSYSPQIRSTAASGIKRLPSAHTRRNFPCLQNKV
jgi:hypothetical protein